MPRRRPGPGRATDESSLADSVRINRPSGSARKWAPNSPGFAPEAQATQLGLPATPTTVSQDDVPIRAAPKGERL
jgi:hypothetical protein